MAHDMYFFLEWDSRFKSGAVLGIDEGDSCNIDEIDVKLQNKIDETDSRSSNQRWITSKHMDPESGIDYLQFVIKCSREGDSDTDMVLSTSRDISDDKFTLTIRSK